MRRILKTNPTPSLRDWIKANKSLPNFNYEALPGAVKQKLKDQLLREQGFICAYSGQEISNDDSHIEHLKPQSLGKLGDDVAYRNVVACFPSNGGDTTYGYGAPIKGQWWNKKLFVSPLSQECDRRFSFTWSGKISAKPRGNAAAEKTISVLCLDNSTLESLRYAAIKAFFGFSFEQKPITKAHAKRLLGQLRRAKPPNRLMAFCFVIEQLLPRYIAGNP
jgi:uncharacterized protein (TIGR02646 family)